MSSGPQWRSSASFVLAALGAAVGLGNIWRFSYVAGEHGGGAFVLAYLLAVVVLGSVISEELQEPWWRFSPYAGC